MKAELRANENAMQLQEDMLKLRQLADTDFMTGLMNRRSFLAVADDAVAFSRRYKRNMATLMIDIDHFKKINDTHGHAAGDDAIKSIADIINQSIRTADQGLYVAKKTGRNRIFLMPAEDERAARAA